MRQERQVAWSSETERQRQLDEYFASYLQQPTSNQESQPLRISETISEKFQANREDYERLSEKLEQECLDLLSLLGKYQVFLRGQVLPHSEIDHPRSTFLPAVRNERLILNSREDKQRVLYALLIEIINRATASRVHSKDPAVPSGVPVILFEIRNFKPDEDSLEPSKPNSGKVFMGQTDDIGVYFQHPRALRAPDEAHFEDFFAYGWIPERRIAYQQSPADEARIRFYTSIAHTSGAWNPYSISVEAFLSNTRTYFHALLYAHSILKAIQEFDKNNPDGY